MKNHKNILLLCTNSPVNLLILARFFSFLARLAIAFPHASAGWQKYLTGQPQLKTLVYKDFFVLPFTFLLLPCCTSALAQISPDETLGSERSVITPNVNVKGAAADQIDGGAIRGSNLFHSFREFNIKDGQRVYFSNPGGINNILGRVTGNNPSDILGTLGVNGNANLFLINPNGIIFGKNASLDVGNSFYATTANSIKFGELGDFSASNPQSPSSLLTINPSAFFFNLGTNRGSIINQSRATQTVQGTPTDGLEVPNGQTLLLLGGNVTVDDGRLIARGGRVEIGAVAGTGSVGLNANGSLNFPDTIQRADVVFNNKATANRSGIDVRLGNGGDIGITAGNISLSGGSQLRAGIASGLGSLESQGGNVIVNATGEVRMIAEDTRMANDIRPNAIGKAGNIQVTTPSLVVTDGAQISASTFGVGDAGNVVITANHISLSGERPDELGISAIFTRVERGAKGKGGNVQIFTNTLDVTNGAQLVAATLGTGNAGNIFIVARDRAFFDGISFGSRFVSGAFSNVGINAGVEVDPDETIIPPQGNGGNLTIETDRLSIRNGAAVSVATAGQSNAGKLRIRAPEFVEVLGTSRNGKFKSQVSAEVTSDAIGSGGSLSIETGQMIILDGAEVVVSSQGTGNAGNLEVKARSIRLDNKGQLLAETASGNGGNMTLQLQDLLLLRRESKISTNSGTAQAGGNGGNITINAPKGFIVASPNENSDITANAFQGSGGKVTINAAGIFGLKQRSRQELEQLLQTTDPTKLDPSQLPTSDITAISQTNPSLNGEVNLNTPDTDPSRGIEELPIDIVDVSRLINQNLCVASRGSEFIVTGRGGLPSSPYEIISADTTWEDWWISPQPQTKPTLTTNNSSPQKQKESTTIIEAQGWVKDTNGNVILTAKPVTVTPKGTWLHPQECQKLRG
jgi:filamentous hemagglutinin family protein